MSLADTLNPFYFRHDEPGVPTADKQGFILAPRTTIYSAIDTRTPSGGSSCLTLAGQAGLAEFATYVPAENDLTVYAIDLEIAADLLNRGRNIRIYCRTLTILDAPKETHPDGWKIDVSAQTDETYQAPAQPTHLWDSPQAGPATSGNDILKELKKEKPNYSPWFDNFPGADWGNQGKPGGNITIACETLRFKGKLTLLADGARGNAGINGQSRNYVEGATGGAGGQGGKGGDGGTIRIDYYVVHDASGSIADIDDYVTVTTRPGRPGANGLPGDAYDDARKLHHPGTSLPEADSGTGGDLTSNKVATLQIEGQDQPLPDLSPVAQGLPLDFWNLLYHRTKLAYIQFQPVTFVDDITWDPQLEDIISWAFRLTLPYGPLVQPVDSKKDKEADLKAVIASAINVAYGWYASGKLMWGFSPQSVSPMPFKEQAKLLAHGYDFQKAIRDRYIALRTDSDTAIKDQATLDAMRGDAQATMEMHRDAYESLRDVVCINPKKESEDSLQSRLIASLNDTRTACTVLQTKLKDFQVDANNTWNFSLSQVLEGLQSMMFVIGDPPALAGMGAIQGAKLFDTAYNTIKNNDGVDVSKGQLKKIDKFNGTLQELANTSVAVGGAADRRDSELVMTTLATIDKFVSQFTDALGKAATDVIDEINEYRSKIRNKNDLLLEYNNQILQMAKEFEEYQAANAKLIALNQKPDVLTKNMLETTMRFASVYLQQLEKISDAMAWLRREYTYVTLSPVPFDYLGPATAFWNADQASAPEHDKVLGEEFVNVTQYSDDMEKYEANQKAQVLTEPDKDDNSGKRSVYDVVLSGDDPRDAPLLEQLVKDRHLLITVVSSKAASDPDVVNPVFLSDEKLIYDARVLNVMPWLEGVSTPKGVVHFQIRTGVECAIADANLTLWHFEHAYGVETDFAHEVPTAIKETDNTKMAGAGKGEVASKFIGSRGIFATYKLLLPKGGSNDGLSYESIDKLKLRICFRMKLRNHLSAPRKAGKATSIA